MATVMSILMISASMALTVVVTVNACAFKFSLKVSFYCIVSISCCA